MRRSVSRPQAPMEDPTPFDVWAKVVASPPPDAGAWLQAARPSLSLLQDVLHGGVLGCHVCLGYCVP